MSANSSDHQQEALWGTVRRVIFWGGGLLSIVATYIQIVESQSGRGLMDWFKSKSQMELILSLFAIFSTIAITVLVIRLRQATRLKKDADNIYKSDFRSRSRICMLIPDYESKDEDLQSDVLLILNGVGRALSALSKDIHSVLDIDLRYYPNRHKVTPGVDEQRPEMIRIVESELRKGTRYFICTTTEACKELSKHFRALIDSAGGGHAILVCTLASGNELITKRNEVYRFFPLASDEGKLLAAEVKRRLIQQNPASAGMRASAIFVNTEYSKALKDGFKTGWAGCWTESTHLENSKHDEFTVRLSEQKDVWCNCDIIFISGTKKAILAILKAIRDPDLSRVFEPKLLVAPSAFDPEDSSKADNGDSLLMYWNAWKIVCSRPKLREGEVVKGSVVEFYVSNSLLKLVDAIKSLRENRQTIEQFHDKWVNSVRPGRSVYDEHFWSAAGPEFPMIVSESDAAKAWIADQTPGGSRISIESKTLLIFPGLSSSQNDSHRKSYDVLKESAGKRGWQVKILTYPGQEGYSGRMTAGLDLNSVTVALRSTIASLLKSQSSVRLIGLSFGCSAVLKLCIDTGLWNWDKVVLWGPTPAFNYWNAFGKGRGKEQLGRGTNISEKHFENAEPFEYLLMQAEQSCDVAVGGIDKYVETSYLSYVEELLRRPPSKTCTHRYHPVPDCSHTVLPTDPGFEKFMDLLCG